MTEQLEFVNDWSELEEAVAELQLIMEQHDGCDPDYCDIGIDMLNFKPYAQVIRDYVPRLLTQYATLLETSFALVEGWEQYASLQGPTGLYLPDHR